MTRCWRLVISYPAGSQEPGWEPPGWDRYATASAGAPPPEWDGADFRWPRERVFLSERGARWRRTLLEGWGATVRIQRSDPVTWPADREVPS